MEIWHWALGIIFPSLVYLLLQSIKQKDMIQAVRSEMMVTEEVLKSIKEDITEIKNSLTLFIKTEIDTLKELAKK